MQEDFQSDRAFYVQRQAMKCPFTAGVIRPYHNMRSKTSLDPETFGSTSVGSTAGSVKDGGTYSPLEERSFIRHKTGLRGGDTLSNTGVETFTNTFHNYQPWKAPTAASMVGLGHPSAMWNTPQNWSNRPIDRFSADPTIFT